MHKDIKTLIIKKPLRLDCGQTIDNFPLAYETYGVLNEKKDNAILIFHALTGDQYVTNLNPVTKKDGWWSYAVGPDKSIDTNKYFIICANVIGGCMGSFGPSHINPKTTFCFFDDHQNALQRMIHCAQLGFQHLMFEDNYPPGKGDCYSLKKAFHASETRTLLPGLAIRDYCENLIDVYQEFPPIISPEMNRWGEPWSTYDVDEPLVTEIQNELQSIYAEESENYTWVNYVKLKEFEKNKHCIQLSDLKKKFDWSSMV